MRKFLGAFLAVCLLSQPASAVFDLQITEIWPGNNPDDSEGNDQTGDWFEVTNVGDSDWTSADGTLYFDDSDPTVDNADEMFGISIIAAGESVLFIDDDNPIPGLTVSIWQALWTGPLQAAGQTVPQIGTYSGSGLGGGGDEVNLFLDTDAMLDITDIVDTEAYDNADGSGGRSWDVVNGIYSHASYAVVTAANNMGNPSTGTPGFNVTVPEPSSFTLLALTGGIAVLRRRK